MRFSRKSGPLGPNPARNWSGLLWPVLFLAATAARADEVYVGASTVDGTYRVTRQATPFKADDDGYRVFGGFRKGGFFFFEGGYLDLGDLEDSAAGLNLSLDLTGVDLFVGGTLPLTRRLELFGKVGAVVWNVDSTLSDGMTLTPSDENGIDLAYGYGLTYRLSQSLLIRGEREILEIEDTDEVELTSIGLEIRF